MSPGLALSIALFVLIGNAFFVGAEFGLVSARRSTIEPLALKGSRRAKITLGAMERVSFMLAGAQLGVTLCSLILGAVGEPLIAHALEEPFHALGIPDGLLHPISLIVALIVMVYFHVVIGEMVPKNIALAGPEKAALALTPPLVLIVKIISPLVHGLNAIANGCLRLIGIKPKGELPSSFTRDEVAGFVEESHREGLLSKNERYLLSGVLRFDQRSVKTVLLTLETIILADESASPASIEQLAAKTGFSRFPIINSQKMVTGYIHLKDVLKVNPSRHGARLEPSLIRPLATVSADATLREALTIMQHTGTHLARVKEHDTTVGIIMLEDILEELVGKIRDDS